MKYLLLIALLFLSGCDERNERVYPAVIKAAQKTCIDIKSTLYFYEFNMTFQRGKPSASVVYVHCKNEYTKRIKVTFASEDL